MKTVLEVISGYRGVIKLSKEELSCIFETWAEIKCSSSKIKWIDFGKLCKLNHNNKYRLTVIQGNQTFSYYDNPAPCYQMNPFESALVFASKIKSKHNSVKILRYDPVPFKSTIYLKDYWELEPNFKLYDVFTKTADGILDVVRDFSELHAKSEIIAISKSNQAIPDFTFVLMYCPEHF